MLSEWCYHKIWASEQQPLVIQEHILTAQYSPGVAGAELLPCSPHRTKAPFPTPEPRAALLLSYVGGIVEQEREASSCTVSDEVPGEFVVEWHQIRERDWLLHDALVPEQRDRH